jgi:hypothetical protein
MPTQPIEHVYKPITALGAPVGLMVAYVAVPRLGLRNATADGPISQLDDT